MTRTVPQPGRPGQAAPLRGLCSVPEPRQAPWSCVVGLRTTTCSQGHHLEREPHAVLFQASHSSFEQGSSSSMPVLTVACYAFPASFPGSVACSSAISVPRPGIAAPGGQTRCGASLAANSIICIMYSKMVVAENSACHLLLRSGWAPAAATRPLAP